MGFFGLPRFLITFLFALTSSAFILVFIDLGLFLRYFLELLIESSDSEEEITELITFSFLLLIGVRGSFSSIIPSSAYLYCYSFISFSLPYYALIYFLSTHSSPFPSTYIF